MKKVNVAPHDLFEWFKAACASGGEGTVAEGAGREIKDYRIEQPTEGGVIGTEFGFTEHNGEQVKGRGSDCLRREENLSRLQV